VSAAGHGPLRLQNVYVVADRPAELHAFYESALGLQLKFRDKDRWFQYGVGNTSVALACREEAAPAASGLVMVLEVSDFAGARERMIRDPENFSRLLAEVRQFVRTECLPREEQVDRTDLIPEALVQRMREVGLFGHSIPEAYGGAGLTSEELSLVNIEVSQVGDHVPRALRRQHRHRLRVAGGRRHAAAEATVPAALASGELTGCLALTEPEAGSEATNVQDRRARRRPLT
jgi:alkylation response protein AidB-like acyl-CoA dehydrogenase